MKILCSLFAVLVSSGFAFGSKIDYSPIPMDYSPIGQSKPASVMPKPVPIPTTEKIEEIWAIDQNGNHVKVKVADRVDPNRDGAVPSTGVRPQSNCPGGVCPLPSQGGNCPGGVCPLPSQGGNCPGGSCAPSGSIQGGCSTGSCGNQGIFGRSGGWHPGKFLGRVFGRR